MEGWNYFSYFTEIEEYFWKKRGAHLLVSPLDWAVMESWQKAGIPLEAVLKGIDRSFESYQRSRRGAGKPLKSLAYCTDAVIEAAEEGQEASAGGAPGKKQKHSADPFSRDELRNFVARNAAKLKSAIQKTPALATFLDPILDSLQGIAMIIENPASLDIEDLERRLTVQDDKLYAALQATTDEETLLRIRREVDGQLAAYRRKMKAEQLALVEKQYTQKRLLEEFGLPRLSLFYLS